MMTRQQAFRLIKGCGAQCLAGPPEQVRAQAIADCVAAARAEGWDGEEEYALQSADEDYIEAQLIQASDSGTP